MERREFLGVNLVQKHELDAKWGSKGDIYRFKSLDVERWLELVGEVIPWKYQLSAYCCLFLSHRAMIVVRSLATRLWGLYHLYTPLLNVREHVRYALWIGLQPFIAQLDEKETN